MKNPRKEKERRFIDVAPLQKRKVLFLKERIFRFELNFSRIAVWARGNKILSGFALLGIIFLVFGVFNLLLHAQVVTLTPSTCLGGWTNSAYAEGMPNATQGESNTYTQENSAVLYNKISEIFCGDFSGEVPEGAVPSHVTLSFSLAMKSKAEFYAEPKVEETNLIQTTSTLPTQTDASSTQIEKTENTSSSQKEILPSAFLNFFHKVFAQEESTPTIEPEVQNIPVVEEITPSSSESNEGAEISSSSPTSSEIIVPTSEEKKNLYDFEYDSVIEVVWSADGTEWHSLGYLSPRNYAQAKFTLPLTSWEELKALQVRLRSVTATDALPAVFLDAVLLDVEFEEINEPILSEEEEFTRMFEGLRLEQMPAGFQSENMTFLQGISRLGVLMKFLNNGKEELWLIGKTITNIDGGKSIAKDFPIGIKGSFVFWLSEDKTLVFAYDIKKKIHYEVLVPPPIIEETERRMVEFSEIPWRVVIASNNFYFGSEATGEVFSDGNSLPVEFFSAKLNLEIALPKEKLETLGVPLHEKEQYEPASE